jgi:hypothetical protein
LVLPGSISFFILRILPAIQQKFAYNQTMDDNLSNEILELKTQITSANLPPGMIDKISRMFAELERSQGAANYFETSERIRHYIDWIIKIPWHNAVPNQLDLKAAKKDPRRSPLWSGRRQNAADGIFGRAQTRARPAGGSSHAGPDFAAGGSSRYR